MSRRPLREKGLRKARKALRSSLPAYFDVVEWLLLRRHAISVRGAESLILQGRVRSESHTVGIVEVPDLTGKLIKVVERYQPVAFRDKLAVVTEDEVE